MPNSIYIFPSPQFSHAIPTFKTKNCNNMILIITNGTKTCTKPFPNVYFEMLILKLS